MLSSSLNDKDIIFKAADKFKTSQQRNLECNLEIKDFVNLFRKGDGKCAYSGEEFFDGHDMTIERLDPKIGYVKGNCVLVRSIYNTRKEPLDRFLKQDGIPDSVKMTILKEAMKVLQRREAAQLEALTEKLNLEAESEARKKNVVSLRTANLAHMAGQMKRTRFSDTK